MKKLILSLTIILLFTATLNVFARNGKGQGEIPPLRRGTPLRDIVFFGGFKSINTEKKRLMLSDEQAERIAGLNIHYKAESLKLDENIRRKQFELDNLLREDNISLNDIRALLTVISKLKLKKEC